VRNTAELEDGQPGLAPARNGQVVGVTCGRRGGRGRRGRVVVGVDGSEGSKDALRWAAGQAQLTGAPLDVLMSWEMPTVPYGVWAGYDFGRDARETVGQMVDEVLGATRGLSVRVTVVEGKPGPVLLTASEGAALLVVGGRGNGPLAALLLGSVSRYCVTHARCPLVVVPRCSGHV
jgi:nucleotide-binding universal stress UspA family protein